MPDFATRWWGQQYEVIRRGPGRDTRHKAWALDVTDAGGRFDPRADLRPGDIVVIRHGRGRAAERVIDTVAPCA
jgi:hypothetical protein